MHLVILLGPILLQGQVPDRYSDEMKQAVSVLEKYQSEIERLASEFDLDPHLVLATVAPEMIRYSQVRDLMETTALELAYVRWGREGADFSIGRFPDETQFCR